MKEEKDTVFKFRCFLVLLVIVVIILAADKEQWFTGIMITGCLKKYLIKKEIHTFLIESSSQTRARDCHNTTDHLRAPVDCTGIWKYKSYAMEKKEQSKTKERTHLKIGGRYVG